ELEEVNEWLYAWLDLLDDPADLEQDVDLLRAVQGLILKEGSAVRGLLLKQGSAVQVFAYF
ncbi:MAG: hypothetical protein ACK56F_19555, partial [bacterium]